MQTLKWVILFVLAICAIVLTYLAVHAKEKNVRETFSNVVSNDDTAISSPWTYTTQNTTNLLTFLETASGSKIGNPEEDLERNRVEKIALPQKTGFVYSVVIVFETPATTAVDVIAPNFDLQLTVQYTYLSSGLNVAQNAILRVTPGQKTVKVSADGTRVEMAISLGQNTKYDQSLMPVRVTAENNSETYLPIAAIVIQQFSATPNVPTETLIRGSLVAEYAVAANPCVLANLQARFEEDPAGTAGAGTVVSRARTFGYTGRVVPVTAHTSRVLETVSTTTTRMFRLTLGEIDSGVKNVRLYFVSSNTAPVSDELQLRDVQRSGELITTAKTTPGARKPVASHENRTLCEHVSFVDIVNIQAFSAIDVEVTLAENPEIANNTFFIAFATEMGASGNISLQAIEEFTTQREMLPYESSESSFTSIPTNVFVSIRPVSQPATEESLTPFAIAYTPLTSNSKVYRFSLSSATCGEGGSSKKILKANLLQGKDAHSYYGFSFGGAATYGLSATNRVLSFTVVFDRGSTMIFEITREGVFLTIDNTVIYTARITLQNTAQDLTWFMFVYKNMFGICINGGRSNGGVNLVGEHAALLKLYTAVKEELATAASSIVTRYPAVKYAELECDTATRVEAIWTVANAISPVDPLNPTQSMAAKTTESIKQHANAAILSISTSESEGTTRITNYMEYATNTTSFMCKLSAQNAALRGSPNEKIRPIVSFVYTSGAEFGICVVSDVGGVAGSYSICLFSRAKPKAAAKVVKSMSELISSQYLKKLGKSVTVFVTKHGDNGQLYSVCLMYDTIAVVAKRFKPAGAPSLESVTAIRAYRDKIPVPVLATPRAAVSPCTPFSLPEELSQSQIEAGQYGTTGCPIKSQPDANTGMVNTRIESVGSVDVEGISHDQKRCNGTSFITYPDLSLADCATKAQQWNNQNQHRANFATFETCPNSKGGEGTTKCTLMNCQSIIDHDTSTLLNLQNVLSEYDFRT